MADDRPSLFPSIVPERGDTLETDLSTEDVADFFDDEYTDIRQVIATAREQRETEMDVNGKSAKLEMKAWLAENCTEQDLQTLAEEAGVNDAGF